MNVISLLTSKTMYKYCVCVTGCKADAHCVWLGCLQARCVQAFVCVSLDPCQEDSRLFVTVFGCRRDEYDLNNECMCEYIYTSKISSTNTNVLSPSFAL